MSKQLLDFARRFALGQLSADEFADTFIERWKQERDAPGGPNDSDEVSERLSSIFCLADLYNPAGDRKEYELDEPKLRMEVRRMISR
jgi:Bacterial self-protective colicin-like immunity